MKHLVTALISASICVANPVLIELDTHYIGGGVLGEELISFQKVAEDIEISLLAGGIRVNGNVKYEREKDAGPPGFRPEVLLDFPLLLPADRYTKDRVTKLFRNVLSADLVKLKFVESYSDSDHIILSKFKNLAIFKIRYLVHIPDEIGAFTISFDYFQDDTIEAGMAFGFYMPLFEDGFNLNQLSDNFVIKFLDPHHLLVGIRGARSKSSDPSESIFAPIAGEVIVISKMGQPVGAQNGE